MLTEATDEGVGIADEVQLGEKKPVSHGFLCIPENPIKMDDLGGFPPIFGNTHVLR